MRGLIGKKLSHSFSKEIHETLDHNEYNLIELSELGSFFQEKNFHAINVTIPYKSGVIPFLDWVSDSAKEVNAVNTIINRDGILYGYNTDIDGLQYTFDYYDVNLNNKVVGIIGNGATSRTVQYVAKKGNAKCIKVFARSPKEAEFHLSSISKHTDIDIIINATPYGMFPNNDVKPLLNLTHYSNLEFVLDLIYNPLRTTLILEAEKHKIKTANGLMMLIHQAVKANELFNDTTYNLETTTSLYNEIYLKQLNIVFIGMPMSGKSHYTRHIAGNYQKTLIDIDKEIESTEGKSIQNIFDIYGEKAFRDIESNIISIFSKGLNKAISTGGGVVLNPENMNKLKQNGVVVFLDVPLNVLKKMSPKDRPLLKDPNNLIKLYNKRHHLYNDYCDIRILKNGLDTKKVIREIEVRIDEYISSKWS